MSRRKIAAGNWKMNLEFEEAMDLARKVSHMEVPEDVEVIMGVPSLYLKPCIDMLLHVPRVDISAQNCHQNAKGAFTGEIAAGMLRSISCPNVIIGHSERREYFHENNQQLKEKVDIAQKNDLNVIFCCGESLDTRKAGKQVEYVTNQLEESLFHLSANDFSKLVIAYEPIWAIGTGETASPEQAQDMHKAIRSFIAKKYSDKVANIIPILYGGSVKAANAKEIFGQKDVDGGLIGGASLDPEQFREIIKSF